MQWREYTEGKFRTSFMVSYADFIIFSPTFFFFPLQFRGRTPISIISVCTGEKNIEFQLSEGFNNCCQCYSFKVIRSRKLHRGIPWREFLSTDSIPEVWGRDSWKKTIHKRINKNCHLKQKKSKFSRKKMKYIFISESINGYKNTPSLTVLLWIQWTKTKPKHKQTKPKPNQPTNNKEKHHQDLANR